ICITKLDNTGIRIGPNFVVLKVKLQKVTVFVAVLLAIPLNLQHIMVEGDYQDSISAFSNNELSADSETHCVLES
ncbi:hypothetical protein FRX31_009503, partial [Thalictrum thalictroides]